MATDRVVLFTQALQNDLVRKLAPGEPPPNMLHVGREESRRLLGENPTDGPLARSLRAFAKEPQLVERRTIERRQHRIVRTRTGLAVARGRVEACSVLSQ